MKQKIVIAGPKVQGVGYRPFLIALADEFEIGKFSVHNSEEDGKQIVIAKADAEDAQLGAFIDAVRARKPKKADVSGIRNEPFEGRVPSIVRTSILSMNSQLLGHRAIESINEKMDLMLNKQDLTIGNAWIRIKCWISKTKQPQRSGTCAMTWYITAIQNG